jgi:hypothetical protein
VAEKTDNTFGPTKVQRGLGLGYFDAVAVIEVLKKSGIARAVGDNPHVIEIIPLKDRIEKMENETIPHQDSRVLGVWCNKKDCPHYDCESDYNCGTDSIHSCLDYIPMKGHVCPECLDFVPEGWIHGCE